MEREDLFGLIQEFRSRIPTSKELAKDTEIFLENLEEETENLLLQLLDTIQQIIDDSPDATLRKKMTDFLETAKNTNRQLTKNELVRIVSQCR